MFDEAVYSRVEARIKEILDSPSVLSVEFHFAGYFDELGIFVCLTDSATPSDLDALSTKACSYLNEVLPKGTGTFKWALSFDRSSKQVGLFYAGRYLNFGDEWT